MGTMDFELGEEHEALQSAAREFAEREFTAEYAMECARERRYPAEAHRRAGEAGLIGVHLPREYGGRDADLLGSVLVIEALCAADPGLGMAISLCSLGSHFTAQLGTAEQKERILPPVAAGRMLTAVAFTEPDHGSDITQLRTVATRDGDHYVIDGVKTLISNGRNASVVTVLCKTDPAASPAYRGFSLILVETDREGFSATELGQKMGLQMMSTAEMTFDGVQVPASNLVGQEGRGFYSTMEFLGQSRIEIAAQALGGAQAALDRSVAYITGRTQGGRRLSEHQVNRHKIADMATKIHTARLLVYRAAWSHDRHGPDSRLASMAKLYAARVAVEVADEAIQLFGGRGYFAEWDVERIYRDVRVTEIYEGTREIQKNTIANSLLRETS
jgi:alkylation response protein AidB-like acyl-CoA dehydrogenase